MSEESSVFRTKVNEMFKGLCRTEWNAMTTGIIVAFLSVMIMAYWRPWGAVGAVRNWGEWLLYGIGMWEDAPKHFLHHTGSVIGVGFIGGAFLSACLGNDFAIRIPPVLELFKGVLAGILMGIGAALAGGCNVGGMYNALGNLAANGFTMWLGLIIGVIFGLKYIYWEMEHISWGSGGAKTIDFPSGIKIVLGIIALAALVWGANQYTEMDSDYSASLGGLLMIAAGLGYAMQRGRWCMVQGFREPHMTGDCTLAKSVAVSIVLVAIGAAVLKYGIPVRFEGESVLDIQNYVRGTFGWGGILGGLVFGFGAMLAGGCGSGTLWRVGEGQIKLLLVVPFFGVSNAISNYWMKEWELEAGMEEASAVFGFGKWIYLPDTFMGYSGTLTLVVASMMAWYVIVTWNEDTNKLLVEM